MHLTKELQIFYDGLNQKGFKKLNNYFSLNLFEDVNLNIEVEYQSNIEMDIILQISSMNFGNTLYNVFSKPSDVLEGLSPKLLVDKKPESKQDGCIAHTLQTASQLEQFGLPDENEPGEISNMRISAFINIMLEMIDQIKKNTNKPEDLFNDILNKGFISQNFAYMGGIWSYLFIANLANVSVEKTCDIWNNQLKPKGIAGFLFDKKLESDAVAYYFSNIPQNKESFIT